MDLTTWLELKPGRAAAVAAYFGVSRAAVTQWKTNGVPLAHMKRLREYSDGEVTLEEMVPAAQPLAAVAVPLGAADAAGEGEEITHWKASHPDATLPEFTAALSAIRGKYREKAGH